MSQLKPGMLSGNKYTENFQVDEDVEIEIRALNYAQSTEIKTLLSSGIKFNNLNSMKDVDIDTEKLIESEAKGHLKACVYGITDPSWTEETIINELPPDYIKKIGERVCTISGIGDPAEIEKFRKGRKGSI